MVNLQIISQESFALNNILDGPLKVSFFSENLYEDFPLSILVGSFEEKFGWNNGVSFTEH